MKIKGKTAEVFEGKFGDIDTKKKLNRSKKEIKQEIFDEIQKEGLTIERLESLPLPVFKYQTQVTIHGVYKGELDSWNRRIGRYVALTKNKNQSLGVKYCAVDLRKKQVAARLIRNLSDYSLYNSSIDCTVCRYMKDKEAAIKEYNRIDESLFIGAKQIGYVPFFNFYFVKIDLLGVYTKNWRAFIKNICDIEDIGAAHYQHLQEEKAKQAKYAKERLEREKENAKIAAENRRIRDEITKPYREADASKRIYNLDDCKCCYRYGIYTDSKEVYRAVYYRRGKHFYKTLIDLNKQIPEKNNIAACLRVNLSNVDFEKTHIFKAF